MKNTKVLLASLCLLLMMVLPVMAKTVTLSWEYDTDKESTITEFRVYQRTPDGAYGAHNYTALPDERTMQFTIPDTDACYVWMMTAANGTYNLESSSSNEVSICVEGGEVVYPFSPTGPLMKTIRVTD